MVVDNSGNTFIGGALMSIPGYTPLIIKVSSAGNLVWEKLSFTSFLTGKINELRLFNSNIYLCSDEGIGVCTSGGAEIWTMLFDPAHMVVDRLGRMVVSSSGSLNRTLSRYSATGMLDFADSLLEDGKVTVDQYNNIYQLSDLGGYTLVKYDSSGVYDWTYTSFPPAPPFGDIGYELLTDFNDDVIVVGVGGSIGKLHSDGSLVWLKSMNGLDSYLTRALITGNNLVAVAGTIPGGSYDQGAAIYDLNGNQNWSGIYNSNPQQEFSVDLAIDFSGFYVIEDSISTTTLIKYDSPFNGNPDFQLMCVDSVWYDTNNSNLVNISVYNGNVQNLNYPSILMVNPAGDTISNLLSTVNYFVQFGNSYLVYTDTIVVPGITDFSSNHFIMGEGFSTRTGVIGWCLNTGVKELKKNQFSLFPNPAGNVITISGEQRSIISPLVFNMRGQICNVNMLHSDAQHQMLDISTLAPGIYVVQIGLSHLKFLKY